jgi:chorismate dehydratase
LDTKIKLGAVSYLNTLPLLYGIRHSPLYPKLDIQLEYPAMIAADLVAGKLDIGLVPVAALQQIQDYQIISDYGIACMGPVASVCIYSQVPLTECTRILLDYQSRSSVALAGILLKEYWHLDLEKVDTKTDDFLGEINGTTAGLVIGDRALSFRAHAPHIYDLGEAWHNMTGLGFVFAVWAANKAFDAETIQAFNEANALGLQHMDNVIKANPFPDYDLHTYYHQNIQYKLNLECLRGMELFLRKLQGD